MPLPGRGAREQRDRQERNAASVLLRVDYRRGDIRHHGCRRQRPHRVLAVLSADHLRIRLGAWCHRGRLLIRLRGVGRGQPSDRPSDGSRRPARGDGAWRRADGRRVVAGAADDAALASLSHHRRHGRRRQRLPRLFRSIAVPAELVHPPPRPCDGNRVRRRRHRLRHLAALGAAHDRSDRLAHRLHRDGPSGPHRAGADQPSAAQTPRGHWARARRR